MRATELFLFLEKHGWRHTRINGSHHIFTKAGCTLCDVAKDVLKGAAAEQPHTLESVDITDPEHAEWWDKYKYDIPVLHINGIYWAKHRITAEDSLAALAAADAGTLEPSRGEPNAAKMERS